MNEKRIKEVFSDEAFVKELVSKETPEEVQALLEDKDIEMSVSEIVKLRELLEKKAEDPNAELSDEDLEDVSGGCLGVAVIASFVVCIGAQIVDGVTGGRW
mgnify:FL=1